MGAAERLKAITSFALRIPRAIIIWQFRFTLWWVSTCFIVRFYSWLARVTFSIISSLVGHLMETDWAKAAFSRISSLFDPVTGTYWDSKFDKSTTSLQLTEHLVGW